MDEISGDGDFGWDDPFDVVKRKRGDVISEMRGRFGSAVSSATSFARKVFSSSELADAPAMFIGAPIHQVADSGESGDLTIGFLSDSRSLLGYRTDMSSATRNSDVSFAFSDGDFFGSSVVSLSSTNFDILFAGAASRGPSVSAGAIGVFTLSATTSGIGVTEFAEIGFDSENPTANYARLASPSKGESAQFFGTSLSLGDLNGGSFPELIVGAPGNKFVYEQAFSVGPTWANPGSVWILELSNDLLKPGVPKVARSIELTSAQVSAQAGFAFASDAQFGHAAIVTSGLMSTGTATLIVGAPGHNNGEGAVFLVDIIYGATVTVKSVQELTPPSDIPIGARFGASIVEIPDANGDGAPDYVIGSPQRFPDGSNSGTGAIHLVSLNNSRSELCSAYTKLHNIDLHAAGFDCDDHGTGPLPSTLNLPRLSFAIKFSSFLGNGTQPPPLAVALALDAGAAFGQSVGFIEQSTFPDLVLVGVGAPFQGSAGSVYVFGFPKRAPNPPSTSPTPSTPPTKSESSDSNSVAWIAAPVLGAFALPFLLYMRRKKRDLGIKKNLTLDHELYLASKFWPFCDFFTEVALGQVVGENLERPTQVSQELLFECLNLPIDTMRTVLHQELTVAQPDLPSEVVQEVSGLCHRDLIPDAKLKGLFLGMFGVPDDSDCAPVFLESARPVPPPEPEPPATFSSKSRSVEFMKPERPYMSKNREFEQAFLVIPEAE